MCGGWDQELLYGEIQSIMVNGHMETSTVTRQRHTTENITFQQLRWRAVNIPSNLHPSKSVRDFALYCP